MGNAIGGLGVILRNVYQSRADGQCGGKMRCEIIKAEAKDGALYVTLDANKKLRFQHKLTEAEIMAQRTLFRWRFLDNRKSV